MMLSNPAVAAEPSDAPLGLQQIGTLDPTTLPTTPPPEDKTTDEIKRSTKSCKVTPAESKERSTGVYKVCAEESAGIPNDLSTAMKKQASENLKHFRAGSSLATPAATTCVVNPGFQQTDRQTYCAKGGTFTFTDFNLEGVPTAVSIFTMDMSYELAPTTTTDWDVQATIQLTSAVSDDPAAAAQFVQLDESCGTVTCNASGDWATPQLIGIGQTVTKNLHMSMPVAKGDVFSARPTLSFWAWLSDGFPITPASFQFEHAVRCDMAVGTSKGCVHPDYKPQLVLDEATYGPAAATYWFAQTYFIDAWGSSASPLHRQASEALAEANRQATCEDGTFVHYPDSVPDDSCDEYPFAKSKEGGGVGASCAEFFPLKQADGKYKFFTVKDRPAPTRTERCVRGHVPLDLNKLAGSALGTFASTSRVLDTDAYTVALTGVALSS
jgi:hypothetical protein